MGRCTDSYILSFFKVYHSTPPIPFLINTVCVIAIYKLLNHLYVKAL